MTTFPFDLKALETARDLETIPMTRGQLVQLMIRLLIAEGMSVAQAEIHAKVQVDATFIHLKSA